MYLNKCSKRKELKKKTKKKDDEKRATNLIMNIKSRILDLTTTKN